MYRDVIRSVHCTISPSGAPLSRSSNQNGEKAYAPMKMRIWRRNQGTGIRVAQFTVVLLSTVLLSSPQAFFFQGRFGLLSL